jgi:hypothetical protein
MDSKKIKNSDITVTERIRQRWEYLSNSIRSDDGEWKNKMEHLGQMGWECISVIQDQNLNESFHYFFKRPFIKKEIDWVIEDEE